MRAAHVCSANSLCHSLATAHAGYVLALIVLMVVAVIGLVAATMLPVTATPPPTPEASRIA